MRPRLCLSAALVSLAALAPLVPAGASAPEAVSFASAHVVAGDLGRASGAPRAWALEALAAQAGRLGVDASAFRVEHVRTSLIGTHVRGRQHRDGVPVAGTGFVVSAIDGRVAEVQAWGSRLPGSPAAAPVGELVARAAALEVTAARRLLAPAHVDRLLVPRAGRLVDTYRVSVLGERGPAQVEIDAASGRVVGVERDHGQHEGESALVFDPNPIQSTRNAGLRQPLDNPVSQLTGLDVDTDSAELTAARKRLPLVGLDPSQLQLGLLTGPWVRVLGTGGYVGGPAFDITRGDPRFEGLMAYAHVDRFQRYLQTTLRLKDVNAEQQEVIAPRLEGYDNSAYFPAEDFIILGAGGVDDGEDAEVIIHEYGHAVHDAQVPGWGETSEGGAMGEGFGDFLAAAYFARTSRGYGDLCVAEWDATSYSTTNPPCLRRVDSKKRYPKDVEDQVHADGQMWSAYLWRVRSRLPGTTVQKSDAALKLVLTSHELLTPQANFSNAVRALRTAAIALGRRDWVPIIDGEARKTGFPLNP